MYSDPNAPPFNPLPWIVWVLTLPMVAVELVLNMAQRGMIGGAEGAGWRITAFQAVGVIPAYIRERFAVGDFSAEVLVRFVAYPFVHYGVGDALIAIVMLLAMGKMVGEVFRPWAVAAVFFGASIVAGLVHVALPFSRFPMVGAFPGVYGLIGAFTFLLWVRLAGMGTQQYRAFTLIGALMAIQILFGALFGGNDRWIAELAGFGAGFLLSFVVSPGGWGRVVAKIRQR